MHTSNMWTCQKNILFSLFKICNSLLWIANFFKNYKKKMCDNEGTSSEFHKNFTTNFNKNKIHVKKSL